MSLRFGALNYEKSANWGKKVVKKITIRCVRRFAFCFDGRCFPCLRGLAASLRRVGHFAVFAFRATHSFFVKSLSKKRKTDEFSVETAFVAMAFQKSAKSEMLLEKLAVIEITA
ncbi:MAG: hypothetical protein NC250_05510 [Alistipes senegalensis]|nr:hypothetical protein [Bacteroides cellulosilyticus]MCM1352169.1 hypothetical protein [Alistipes senegalensis]